MTESKPTDAKHRDALSRMFASISMTLTFLEELLSSSKYCNVAKRQKLASTFWPSGSHVLTLIEQVYNIDSRAGAMV